MIQTAVSPLRILGGSRDSPSDSIHAACIPYDQHEKQIASVSFEFLQTVCSLAMTLRWCFFAWEKTIRIFGMMM
jgi:hypothetical protein